MEKPTPKTVTSLDFNECTDYINYKYNCDTRDFAGKFQPKYNPDAEYLDFWHWVIDHHEVHNGCYIHFWKSELEYFKTTQPDWVVKIYGWYLEEFADESGELEMWVSW